MNRFMWQSARPRWNPWLIVAVLALASTVAAGCEDDNAFIVTSGGSPVITLLEVPSQVNAGGAFLVNVGAIARRGVAKIEVRLSGAYSDTSTFTFDPVRMDTVPVSFTVTVPDTVTGLLIRVEAVATDAHAAVSRPESRNINVLNQAALSAAADALPVAIGAAPSFGSARVAFASAARQSSSHPLRAGPVPGT